MRNQALVSGSSLSNDLLRPVAGATFRGRTGVTHADHGFGGGDAMVRAGVSALG